MYNNTQTLAPHALNVLFVIKKHFVFPFFNPISDFRCNISLGQIRVPAIRIFRLSIHDYYFV